MRWHCPPDTGFEIRALAVWGRARYFSVMKAPHNTDFYTWMGKKHFCFFQTAETGNRTLNSGVKGSGANSGTQTFRPIVSSHHYLVRRSAPNSYSGKTFRPPPPHLIHRKDVSPPCSYFRKTFCTLTIFQKDVSHPIHISERCFAPKPYFRKMFRTHFIIRKHVSPPLHIYERRFASNQKDVSPPSHNLESCFAH